MRSNARQTVVVHAGVGVESRAAAWRRFGAAAVVSVLTMPLTAMWFLLVGGVLLVAGLLPRALRSTASIGTVSIIGLGLLAGPAVYLSLGLAQ
jgi:hypothetical protein